MPRNHTLTELKDLATDKDYPETEWGRPDGRDYHYRVPLADDAAAELAFRALKGRFPYGDRFVVEWDEFAGDELSYIGIRTNDSKGHLVGLAEFAHSPRWRDAGVMTDIDEYRPVGGAVRIRGSFIAYPEPHNRVSLTFDTTVNAAIDEFETALDSMDGEVWTQITMAMSWAKDEAIEQYREDLMDYRRHECDHPHPVEVDGNTYVVARSPDAVAVCEECGAELDERGNVV